MRVSQDILPINTMNTKEKPSNGTGNDSISKSVKSLAQSSNDVIEPAEIPPTDARPIEVPQTKSKEIHFQSNEIQFQSKEIQLKSVKKNKKKLKPLPANKQQSFPPEDECVQCNICMNKFLDETQLKDHQQTHFAYKCRFCEKTFQNGSNVVCHERIHTGELPYVCKYCNRAYNHRNSCKKHSETCELKNVNQVFKCNYCPISFALEQNRIKHEYKHGYFKCFKCFYSFKCWTSLNCHLRAITLEKNVNSMNVDQIEVNPKIEHNQSALKKFKCKYCSRNFDFLTCLRKHSKIHNSHLPFKCTYCSVSFNRNDARVQHERLHTEENPNKCPKCSRSFLHKTSISNHLKRNACGKRVFLTYTNAKSFAQNVQVIPLKCGDRSENAEQRSDANDHSINLEQGVNSLSNVERITSELSKEISLDHQANGDIPVAEIPITKKTFREIHRRKRTIVKSFRYRNRFISFSSDKYRVRHTGKIYKCLKCLKYFHTKYSFMKHVKRNSCGKSIKVIQVQNTDEVQQKSDECSNTNVPDNKLSMACEKHTDTSESTIQCVQVDCADQIERGSETQCETTDLLTSVKQQGSLPNVEAGFTNELSHESTLESETRNSIEIQLKSSTNNQITVKIPMDTQAEINIPVKNTEKVPQSKKNFTCELCSKRFGKKEYLRRHRIKIHIIAKAFKCSYCPVSFNVKHRQIAHERNHTGENFLEWLNAKAPNHPHDFATKNAQKVKLKQKSCEKDTNIGQKKMNGKKSYECPNCSYKCEDKWSLNRHLKRKDCCEESEKDDQQSDSNHDEESLTGRNCLGSANEKIIPLPSTSEANCLPKIESEEIELDENQPEYQQLEDHCESNETMNQDDSNDDESIEDIFVKEEPRLDFDYEQAFQVNDQSSDEDNLIETSNISADEQNIQSPNQAKQTFEKNMPVACVNCGERFINRNQCDLHMKSCHEFKCFFCPLKFQQIDDRNQHHATHADTKSHVCEFCLKSFDREYSLMLHRRIHTGEKPFECEICQKRFTLKHILVYHRKTHDLNGENYPCDKCNKVYKYSRSLLRHQVGKHRT